MGGREEHQLKDWPNNKAESQAPQNPRQLTSLAEINRLLAESSESLIDPDHVQTIPVKKGSISGLPHHLDSDAMRRLAFNSSIEQSARESEDEVNRHPMYVKLHSRNF